jgi:PAS domain S-box-containing protein
MSKKQIQNRLNNLFVDLQPEEDTTILINKQTPKKPIVVLKEKPKKHPAPVNKTDTIEFASFLPVNPTTNTTTQFSTTGDFVNILTLPFQMDPNNWGMLEIGSSTDKRIFSREEQQLVKQVVDQLSLALENANLFQQTQVRAEELAILNEMGQAFTANLDVGAIIENIYIFSSRLLDTYNFYIALYDSDTDEVTFPLSIDYGKRVTYPPRRGGKGLTEHILRLGQPLLLADNASEKTRALGIEVIGDESQSWLGIPMVVGGKVSGMIGVQSYTQPNAFTQNSLNLLTAIAGQAAIAVQNAKLLIETRQRNEELGALNEIIGAASQTLSIDEILQDVLSKVLSTINISAGLISLYNPLTKRLESRITKNIPENLSKQFSDDGLEGTLSAAVYNTEDVISIQDFGQGTPLDVNNLILSGFKAYLGVPLEAHNEILGTLCTFNTVPLDFQANTIELLRSVGRQIGFAIDNARLFQDAKFSAEEARKRSADLEALNNLSQNLTSQLNLEQVLNEVFEGISRLIDSSNFYIGLYNENQDSINFIFNVTESVVDKAIVSLPADRGITGYIIKTHEPVLIKENLSGWLIEKGIEQVGEPAKSWLGAPLLIGSKILGVMAVQDYKKPFAYDEHHKDMMLAIANQASISIQNARLFDATKTSENLMRSLIENAPEAILVIDIETNLLTDPNSNAINLFGFDKKDLIKKSLLDVSPGNQSNGLNSSNLFHEKIQEAFTGVTSAFDWDIITKAGGLIPCEIRLVQLPESNHLFRATITDISDRKASENLETALRTISDSALLSQDISTLLPSIHLAIQKLIPSENFYIALYDDSANMLSFPYYVDKYDAPPQGRVPLGKTLTGYLIRSGNPILITPEKVRELEQEGEISTGGDSGTVGVDWLGAPLKSGDRIIGAMVVQTYDTAIRLTERDKETFTFVANQVAIALNRIQSDSELRALFSSMTDVIVVYDKEGRYIRIAPTNPSRLFRAPADLLGKTIQEALPKDTHEPFMAAINNALKTGETTKLEYSLEIEGQKYWFDASVAALGEDQVFWVARDITDRKQFEETLSRQNEYLATSAEIGRLITSTLDLQTLFSRTVNLITERFGFYYASIFIIEETGFNAVLQEATGKAGEEMKRNHHFLTVGSRSIVGTVASTGKSLIVSNTAIDTTFRPNPLLPDTRAEAAIPLRIGQRTIGAIDIQSTKINAFMQDDIQVLQALADQVAVAIDNARSYELSQEAVREMRELDRIKSQFLANMSHELRTPLNSIIGFSRVILKGIDGPLTDLQQQDLNAIYNSGQHLLRLINDILDLSKIDAGKMELAFDDVNVADTINSVIPTINGVLKDKPIQLKQSIAPNLPLIRADPMRLRQVLINLLSNAAKFTDDGIITVEAGLILNSAGQQEIMVSVNDTGPGIAPEDQAMLFQPFTQVDASATRKTGGTGLGLSISRSLIEMHGGRIGVHSTVGKGSTFYFTLAIPKIEPKEISPSNIGTKIILSIDDDVNVTNLYERYLQPQGYQVIALSDPTQVKDRISQLHPIAITLDIMMPGRDGWSVLNDLKSDPETRDIPVIVCSILEAEDKGFNLGASEYLVKPILEDDLLNALNRLNQHGNIHEVLVIDDDPTDLRLIGKMLDSYPGFRAILAEGGEQGWGKITSNPPSAIILDLFMPKMDGFSILEKLRATPGLTEIPVVVVSGLDLSSDQKKQLDEFGQKLLQKGSINEKELLQQLDKALSQL